MTLYELKAVFLTIKNCDKRLLKNIKNVVFQTTFGSRHYQDYVMAAILVFFCLLAN